MKGTRMRGRLLLIACGAMLLAAGGARPALAGGGGTGTLHKHSEKHAERKIHDVLDAQEVAWNNGDVDEFMEGYWNSSKTEFVGANGILSGWKAVLDRYRKAYPDKKTMGTLTFSGLEIEMLGKDAALVVGKWELKREKDHPGGVFTLVFRHFQDGWKIVNDHTSEVKAKPAKEENGTAGAASQD
jgi:ketosteroid isomerase-like protein